MPAVVDPNPKVCSGCRFWSALHVRPAVVSMQHICLAAGGPRRGQFTGANYRCESWASGHAGAVDALGVPDPYPADPAVAP